MLTSSQPRSGELLRPAGPLRAGICFLLIGAMSAPTLLAAAPAAAAASLEGSVVISDGEAGQGAAVRPVIGAIVRAADVASGEVHDSTATGENGNFRIAALPPGRYSVAVQTEDGLFVTGDVLTLVAGQPGRVSFALAGREDSAGGGEAAAPARRKYDCSTREETTPMSSEERREKREVCGWWATANGWAKFGIIAGSAVAFGLTAYAISNDGGDDSDKEKNPSNSSPSSSSAP